MTASRSVGTSVAVWTVCDVTHVVSNITLTDISGNLIAADHLGYATFANSLNKAPASSGPRFSICVRATAYEIAQIAGKTL